ncbi:hypothetical protein STEG23_033120, partial [Scotinomys teguina]
LPQLNIGNNIYGSKSAVSPHGDILRIKQEMPMTCCVVWNMDKYTVTVNPHGLYGSSSFLNSVSISKITVNNQVAFISYGEVIIYAVLRHLVVWPFGITYITQCKDVLYNSKQPFNLVKNELEDVEHESIMKAEISILKQQQEATKAGPQKDKNEENKESLFSLFNWTPGAMPGQTCVPQSCDFLISNNTE